MFGKDAGPITWLRDGRQGGTFVQWSGGHGKATLAALLKDRKGLKKKAVEPVETIEFETGPSGVMVLFDSSEHGSGGTGEREIVALWPGRCRVEAYRCEVENLVLTIRDIKSIDPWLPPADRKFWW